MATPFWKQHLIWPLLAFIVSIVLVEWNGLDLGIADWIYHLEGYQWSLKNNFITSDLLHEAGRRVSQGIGILFLILALISHYNRHLAPYKRGLWLLFLTLASGSLLVGVLKSITHVHCPWDLTFYGGKNTYQSFLDFDRINDGGGRCFPAGHASGGYGLFGLYFFMRHYYTRWRYLGLWVAILAGMTFGIAQQLRGAHFLSHDLWSLILCWLCALFFYWLLFIQPDCQSIKQDKRNRLSVVNRLSQQHRDFVE